MAVNQLVPFFSSFQHRLFSFSLGWDWNILRGIRKKKNKNFATEKINFNEYDENIFYLFHFLYYIWEISFIITRKDHQTILHNAWIQHFNGSILYYENLSPIVSNRLYYLHWISILLYLMCYNCLFIAVFDKDILISCYGYYFIDSMSEK